MWDDSQMNIKEIDFEKVDWMYLAQDSDQWQALMDLWVS
jgi:hypothetical protein